MTAEDDTKRGSTVIAICFVAFLCFGWGYLARDIIDWLRHEEEVRILSVSCVNERGTRVTKYPDGHTVTRYANP